MNAKELEEYRYDVATELTKRMSKGTLFQYAHDKVLQTISEYSEEKLAEILPKPKQKKTHNNKLGFH
tara:strand:+ start:940 stop:1140 length:201 start_codon:yes stop_codon:yes gene_type:complete